MRVSEILLNNLIRNEDFIRRANPYFKEEYFETAAERATYRHVDQYIATYNVPPTFDAILVAMSQDKAISEVAEKEIDALVGRLKTATEKQELNWLLTTAEHFCRQRALYNAIMSSIQIYEGKDKTHDWGAIPSILNEALAVSFDNSVGHDWMSDAPERFTYYNTVEDKFEFDVDFLNKITLGGVAKKTLNVLVAGPHAGKTAMLCHLATGYLKKGLNVLYITNEIAEKEIGRRIDANLLDVNIEDLANVPKSLFFSGIDAIKQKTGGTLKIKEYPATHCHVGHIAALLDELRLKQGFEPAILIVDYLNIMSSNRIKLGQSVNTYVYIKSISEELRGLATERQLPVWTATQFNRTGAKSSDPDMDTVSECVHVDELVTLSSGEMRRIVDVQIGDGIMSHDGIRTILNKSDVKRKRCFRVGTKSGRSIVVSGEHVIPTARGRLSIVGGLCVGDKVRSADAG